MGEQKFCRNCGHANRCQDIYRKMGNVEIPSVLLKVVIAFVLPMVFFIFSLVIFQRVLSEIIISKAIGAAVSFGLAVTVTFVCILISSALRKNINPREK